VRVAPAAPPWPSRRPDGAQADALTLTARAHHRQAMDHGLCAACGIFLTCSPALCGRYASGPARLPRAIRNDPPPGCGHGMVGHRPAPEAKAAAARTAQASLTRGQGSSGTWRRRPTAATTAGIDRGSAGQWPGAPARTRDGAPARTRDGAPGGISTVIAVTTGSCPEYRCPLRLETLVNLDRLPRPPPPSFTRRDSWWPARRPSRGARPPKAPSSGSMTCLQDPVTGPG
jgi:hypothetical protein